MTKRHASETPRPVRTGRYRYTKWRWRIMVGAFDAVGGLATRVGRSLRPPTPRSEPRSILVVQLDHMGDAILTSPLLARLRRAYPDAVIDVLASPSNRAVFASNPDVDHVRVASKNWFERRPGGSALFSAVWTLGRTLKGRGYDLGIDVRGDILTVLVLALAGIPRRLGWRMGGGGFLLTDVAEWVPGRHEVRSRLALAEQLGIDPDSEGPSRVVVHADDADRIKVARWLREAWPVARTAARVRARVRASTLHSKLVGSRQIARSPWKSHGDHSVIESASSEGFSLDVDRDDEPDSLHAGRFGEEAPLLAVHLGAGTAAKRWPRAHWQALIDRFLADGWRILLIGGPDDVAISAAIRPHPGLRDWSGRLAVTETSALLERADFFVGSDSGPAHVAASAGVPSLILFSGTNRPAQWRPWSRRTMILRNRTACRPCHVKTCPLADHPCMAGITPDRAYRAATQWWRRLHRSESPHGPI